MNTKGALLAEDQCKSRLSIKYQFLMVSNVPDIFTEDIRYFLNAN